MDYIALGVESISFLFGLYICLYGAGYFKGKTAEERQRISEFKSRNGRLMLYGGLLLMLLMGANIVHHLITIMEQ